MSARGDRLRQMEREIAKFHAPTDARDSNHKHYLAELAQYLRTVQDPLDVLRFVERLLASPYARRPQQKQALVDVGEWLFTRLLFEPRIERDVLAYELGWMQRLVLIRAASQGATQAPAQTYGRAPQVTVPDFRAKIASIESKRAAPVIVKKYEPPKPPPRVAPTQLPDVLEADFVDITAMREARKKARERQKAGRDVKTTWIALKPTDVLLVPLAKGLACTFETQGFDALFEDLTKRAGVPRAFWVSEIRSEDGRLVVGRIALAKPT